MSDSKQNDRLLKEAIVLKIQLLILDGCYISQQAFRQLEASGVTARVLQLEMTDDRLTLASFIRVEPEALDNFGL